MVTFEDRVPTVDEQRAVAEAVGWLDHFDWETIGGSLERSLHGVVALQDGAPDGVGRLVGDGVRYCYVQDVMVDPAASDQGIATTIVERLLEWVRAAAPAEAVVGLLRAPRPSRCTRASGSARPTATRRG